MHNAYQMISRESARLRYAIAADGETIIEYTGGVLVRVRDEGTFDAESIELSWFVGRLDDGIILEETVPHVL